MEFDETFENVKVEIGQGEDTIVVFGRVALNTTTGFVEVEGTKGHHVGERIITHLSNCVIYRTE